MTRLATSRSLQPVVVPASYTLEDDAPAIPEFHGRLGSYRPAPRSTPPRPYDTIADAPVVRSMSQARPAEASLPAAAANGVTLPWAVVLCACVTLSCSAALNAMVLLAIVSGALTAFVTVLAVARSAPAPSSAGASLVLPCERTDDADTFVVVHVQRRTANRSAAM